MEGYMPQEEIEIVCSMANYFDLSADNSYFPEFGMSLFDMELEMGPSNFTGADWRAFGRTLRQTPKFFPGAEIEGRGYKFLWYQVFSIVCRTVKIKPLVSR